MRRGIVLTAALVAFSLPAKASSDGFHPSARISWDSYTTGIFSQSGFRQNYDLRLDKAVTDAVSCRLFLRGDDFRGNFDAGERDDDAATLQLRPGGEIRIRSYNVDFQGRYEATRVRSQAGHAENERSLDLFNARFSWAPERLPAVHVIADRRDSYDDGTGLDRRDDQATLNVHHAWGPVRLNGSERYRALSDDRQRFGRRSRERFASLAFEDIYFDGKLSAFANVTSMQSVIRQEVTGSGISRIPNPVPIARALTSVDDTPLDGRDRPLVSNPALIDGNDRLPAGISLGHESLSYQNIALDLGRVREIDEIRVLVRNANGEFVRFAGPVRFDVFRSDDGERWVPLERSSRTEFEPALSLYSVSFPLLNTRWIKIVNFGVNAEETLVTEVEAYFHVELSSAENGRRRTEGDLRTANAGFTLLPSTSTRVSYYGYVNSNRETIGRQQLESEDQNHQASLEVEPLESVSLLARYELRSSEQMGLASSRAEGWTAVARYLPTTALDISVELTKGEEEAFGFVYDRRRKALRTYARVIPAVVVGIDLGEQEQDYQNEDLAVISRFMSGTVQAQITRTVQLLLGGSFNTSEQTGSADDVLGLPPRTDNRYYADITWRPGRPLMLGGRFGWVESEEMSAPIQHYRIDWTPFYGGTFTIGGTFDQDVDPYFNRTSRRFTISPRWAINRNARLDISYMSITTTGDVDSSVRGFNASLTVTR